MLDVVVLAAPFDAVEHARLHPFQILRMHEPIPVDAIVDLFVFGVPENPHHLEIHIELAGLGVPIPDADTRGGRGERISILAGLELHLHELLRGDVANDREHAIRSATDKPRLEETIPCRCREPVLDDRRLGAGPGDRIAEHGRQFLRHHVGHRLSQELFRRHVELLRNPWRDSPGTSVAIHQRTSPSGIARKDRPGPRLALGPCTFGALTPAQLHEQPPDEAQLQGEDRDGCDGVSAVTRQKVGSRKRMTLPAGSWLSRMFQRRSCRASKTGAAGLPLARSADGLSPLARRQASAPAAAPLVSLL